MPTYGYRCEKNGHEFEVFQGMTDPPLKRCTVCGSKVRRIFYPVGIVFKGPGFYKTDSRGGSSSTVAPAADKASDSKPDTKADVKAEPAGGGKDIRSASSDSPKPAGKTASKAEKKSA